MWAMCVAPKYGAASRMFKTTEGTTSHLTKLANYANPVIGYVLDITALLKDSKSGVAKRADKSTFRFFVLSRLVLPSLVTF